MAGALANAEATPLPRAFEVVVGRQRLRLSGVTTREEAIAQVEQHLRGHGRPLAPPLRTPPPAGRIG